MNNFELDTKGDKGSPAASGATAAGTRPSRRRRDRSAYPPNSLPSATKGTRTMILGSRSRGAASGIGSSLSLGSSRSRSTSAPHRFQRAGVKVAAPAPSAPLAAVDRPQANSGVNVASCLLAAPPPPLHPPAARARARARRGSERRSSQMRRRSTISASIRGSTRRAPRASREKRRASAVLAGGSWSGYVVTNPPREQPLNEDDCVYVFMSLRQLRDASAPNGRLSLLDNLRPRAPPPRRRRTRRLRRRSRRSRCRHDSPTRLATRAPSRALLE